MVCRLLLFASFTFLYNRTTFAQFSPDKISVGIESSFLIGGEMNASFDFLTGVRGTYIFEERRDLHLFSSLGFATDVANPNSRLLMADAQLGFYWPRRSRLSFFASTGVNYLQESHRFLLNDGEQSWQRSSFDWTGDAGIKLRLSQSISSTLFVKQINLNFTSIGLGLNYTF